MRKKIVSTLLIMIGIAVIFLPHILEAHYANEQKRLIEEWNQSLQIIDYGFLDIGEVDNSCVEECSEEELSKDEDALEEESSKTVGNILSIPKISLEMPILYGVSDRNLNISVASFEGGILPGEKGNYALAAHRGHSYGSLFNRLDELEKGDYIFVRSKGEVYKYIVEDVFLVLPNEVWVLEDNDIKEITLITCDPIYNPTHRLIVKGILNN